MSLIHVLAAGVRRNNKPLSGGLAFFYQSGTETLLTVYAEDAISVPPGGTRQTLGNPVTLDSEGRCFAYADVPVHVIVQDANGVEVIDFDPGTDSASTTLDKVKNDATTQASFTGTTAAWDVQQIIDSLNGKAITPISALDAKALVTQAGAVGRKVRNYFSDILNVKSFGATGDGTTDDGPFIRLAITAGGTGNFALYFPAGTYSVQSSLLAFASMTNVLICGDGPGSVIKFTLSNAALIDLQSGTSNITICDLALQGAGTTSTTTAVGIQVSATSQDVRIHDVRLTGPSAGTGFNVGVQVLSGAKDIWVDGCKFTRHYFNGTTTGTGVYCNGGIRTTVANCHFIGDDSGSNQMSVGVYGDAADRLVVTNNTIENCLNAGIYFATCAGSGSIAANNAVRNTSGGSLLSATANININAGTYNVVSDNVCIGGGNSAHGILVQASTRCKIADNICQGNTNDGINVFATSTRLSLSGNLCTGNSRYGISYTSSTDSADPHNGGIVASNICERNLQSGFYFQGASYLQIVGNQSNENSVTSSGTYPAYDVTTANPSGTHRGGFNNSFVGNSCRDQGQTGAAPYHLCALRINDSAGGSTNVISTTATANDFPPQGSTPIIFIVGGVNNAMRANLAQNKYGYYVGTTPTGPPNIRAYLYANSNTTLTIDQIGRTIMVDSSSNTVTITLPDMGAASLTAFQNCGWLRVLVWKAGNAVTVTAAGANTMYLIGPGAVTSTSTSARGAHLDLMYFNGVWVPASNSSTTSAWA